MKRSPTILLAVTAFFVGATVTVMAGPKKPEMKVMRLDAGEKDYLPLLEGPPQTVTMRSGLVVLAPGKSVGKHSTEDYEEMVIALDGQGEMRVTGGSTLKFEKGMAVYGPPNTEHDVFNTGTAVLRYVYVVAKAVK